jgi:hypothetical protein
MRKPRLPAAGAAVLTALVIAVAGCGGPSDGYGNIYPLRGS